MLQATGKSYLTSLIYVHGPFGDAEYFLEI